MIVYGLLLTGITARAAGDATRGGVPRQRPLAGQRTSRSSSLTSPSATARSSSTALASPPKSVSRSRQWKGERNPSRDGTLHLDDATQRNTLRTKQPFVMPNSFLQWGISCPGCKRRLRPATSGAAVECRTTRKQRKEAEKAFKQQLRSSTPKVSVSVGY
jgi:hypothetical protein